MKRLSVPGNDSKFPQKNVKLAADKNGDDNVDFDYEKAEEKKLQ